MLSQDASTIAHSSVIADHGGAVTSFASSSPYSPRAKLDAHLGDGHQPEIPACMPSPVPVSKGARARALTTASTTRRRGDFVEAASSGDEEASPDGGAGVGGYSNDHDDDGEGTSRRQFGHGSLAQIAAVSRGSNKTCNNCGAHGHWHTECPAKKVAAVARARNATKPVTHPRPSAAQAQSTGGGTTRRVLARAAPMRHGPQPTLPGTSVLVVYPPDGLCYAARIASTTPTGFHIVWQDGVDDHTHPDTELVTVCTPETSANSTPTPSPLRQLRLDLAAAITALMLTTARYCPRGDFLVAIVNRYWEPMLTAGGEPDVRDFVQAARDGSDDAAADVQQAVLVTHPGLCTMDALRGCVLGDGCTPLDATVAAGMFPVDDVRSWTSMVQLMTARHDRSVLGFATHAIATAHAIDKEAETPPTIFYLLTDMLLPGHVGITVTRWAYSARQRGPEHHVLDELDLQRIAANSNLGGTECVHRICEYFDDPAPAEPTTIYFSNLRTSRPPSGPPGPGTRTTACAIAESPPHKTRKSASSRGVDVTSVRSMSFKGATTTAVPSNTPFTAAGKRGMERAVIDGPIAHHTAINNPLHGAGPAPSQTCAQQRAEVPRVQLPAPALQLRNGGRRE